MKKIIVTILIIICASLLMLGLVGCVNKNNQSSSGEIGATEGLHYQKIAGKQEYAVIGLGMAEEIDIVIPSTYKGLPVTKIGDFAFQKYTGLTSVVIGDSVTSIGNSAFEGCYGLTSVVIGDSVTKIGGWAFYDCSGLKNIYYKGTQAQWNSISKGYEWDFNTGSYTITYNYTGE